MSDRLLIVGEAPSRRTDGGAPLSGECGARLAEWAGLDRLDERFDVANVFDEWPGSAGSKGSAFPAAAARERVLDPLFVERVVGYDRVVLLGRRVARAFGFRDDVAWFEWGIPIYGPFAGIDFTIFPHPSRANLLWNDVRYVAEARRVLRELLEPIEETP